MNLEREIAHDLLSIGAVFLRPDEPFTWASGIKSPIYCDNRLTLTAPAVRTDVEEGLVELIRTHYPDVEVLMGTSTAGIAHAAIVGHLMDLPMGYVRSGNKDHGRQNRIEGKLEKGQKVVVVEDLISTAGSCIEVVEALREAGANVLGIVSIFTYGLQKGLEVEDLRGLDPYQPLAVDDFDYLSAAVDPPHRVRHGQCRDGGRVGEGQSQGPYDQLLADVGPGSVMDGDEGEGHVQSGKALQGQMDRLLARLAALDEEHRNRGDVCEVLHRYDGLVLAAFLARDDDGGEVGQGEEGGRGPVQDAVAVYLEEFLLDRLASADGLVEAQRGACGSKDKCECWHAHGYFSSFESIRLEISSLSFLIAQLASSMSSPRAFS